jgi:hypothetical protein
MLVLNLTGFLPNSDMVAARHQCDRPRAAPVFGYVARGSPDGFADRLRGFRQRLKETGYVEGENLAIEYRWGYGRLAKHGSAPLGLTRRSGFVRRQYLATTGPPSNL